MTIYLCRPPALVLGLFLSVVPRLVSCCRRCPEAARLNILYALSSVHKVGGPDGFVVPLGCQYCLGLGLICDLQSHRDAIWDTMYLMFFFLINKLLTESAQRG